MFQNDQTHFKNPVGNATRFSKCEHFGALCFKQLKIIWNVQTIQVEAQPIISACLTVFSRLSIDLQGKGSVLYCKILKTVIDFSKGFCTLSYAGMIEKEM